MGSEEFEIVSKKRVYVIVHELVGVSEDERYSVVV